MAERRPGRHHPIYFDYQYYKKGPFVPRADTKEFYEKSKKQYEDLYRSSYSRNVDDFQHYIQGNIMYEESKIDEYEPERFRKPYESDYDRQVYFRHVMIEREARKLQLRYGNGDRLEELDWKHVDYSRQNELINTSNYLLKNRVKKIHIKNTEENLNKVNKLGDFMMLNESTEKIPSDTYDLISQYMGIEYA
jgi:hypothetical protein